LAYSVAAGRQARLVTRTIVSTDDEEIAAVARRYGAETPFLRPAEYAQDQTTDLPVFQHALRWLAEHEGYQPEIVVQLRPTSPIRAPGDVDRAVQLLLDHPEADSVRSVVPSDQNPYKMYHLQPDGTLRPLLTAPGLRESYNAPRQALPPTYWHVGYIDVMRTQTIFAKDSLSGDVILSLMLEPRYNVDIDTPLDWQHAERRLAEGGWEFVKPSSEWRAAPVLDAPRSTLHAQRPLPQTVALVVFDFDGVMTDNRAWVDEAGHEQVAVSRSDGMGVARLRQAGISALVLSSEPNPVVAARCRKLELPVLQGLAGGKAEALRAWLAEHNINPAQVVYLGNDVNDLPCFPLVGCAVVVADAHPEALAAADLTLSRAGGQGAVRELCDKLVNREE
jgi:N-acylneuraminate cytidylyltransferase